MKRTWHKAWSSVTVCVINVGMWADVGANIDLYTQRSEVLFSKLRCLTCLHQSVSDSDSPFAEQVKNDVQQAVRELKSDEQILSDLARKYGQQVLWSPPKQGFHWVVWLMPAGLVLVVLLKILWQMMHASRLLCRK